MLEAERRGEVVVVVSLDIANAFNSLPHSVIREALDYFEVPAYLGRQLNAYLSDREIVYEDRSGSLVRVEVDCGVTQGSVLGPNLWDLGYDWALWKDYLLPGMDFVCYADDKYITFRGKTYRDAARLAEEGISLVLSRIEQLGLRVRMEKTEAVLFHGLGRKECTSPCRRVGGQGESDTQMSWTHPGREVDLRPTLPTTGTEGREGGVSAGPATAKHRGAQWSLQAAVLRGLPEYSLVRWSNLGGLPQLRRAQRVISVRVIRGYRTVSWVAATALAGDLPWELVAMVPAEVRLFVSQRRSLFGESPNWEELSRVRKLGQEWLLRRWGEDLAQTRYGQRTAEALRPVLAPQEETPHLPPYTGAHRPRMLR
ncbi:uncharacterized protein LOC121728882 [Aricia agestis]|uniref:uncharacterized protein LOC121728882 n=1 Tax=Aricia agestis TaxID=91739 RepID=UPI001C20B26B|nr:uncharacterized protein LOC121728882 [Aricia agestis]